MTQTIPVGFIKNDVFIKCRLEKKLKRASLAHYLNIDLSTINKVESTRYKGFNINLYVVAKYSKYFGIPIEDFIDFKKVELNQ